MYLNNSTSHGIINASGSNALSSSILECRLYVKHSILMDSYIGETKDEIELLLAEEAGGGGYIFVLNPIR